MTTPKISIIVPVYGTEQYVLQCLESIYAQTFSDYEVIIVNDGSPDNCEALISQFIKEKQLDYFYLVTKENGGVSSARNTGLLLAKGEWIAFIDSDDWIGPDYLKDMMNAIGNSMADYCLTQFRAFDEAAAHYDVWSNYPKAEGTIPNDLYALSSLDYVWGRLYKKSIITDHNILFDSRIKYCEDNAFNFDYVPLIKSFICVDGDYYNYRRGRAGALSQSMVLPKMRAHFSEHCQRFCTAFDPSVLTHALKHNISFSHIMWNVLSTDLITDILDGNYAAARKKRDDPLSKMIVDTFSPRSRKAQLLQFLCKYSFPGLVLLVKLYYSNLETLRRHKRFFHFISHK